VTGSGIVFVGEGGREHNMRADFLGYIDLADVPETDN